MYGHNRYLEEQQIFYVCPLRNKMSDPLTSAQYRYDILLVSSNFKKAPLSNTLLKTSKPINSALIRYDLSQK